MIKKLLKNLLNCDTPDPPYQYDFLIKLEQKDYPKYLKKLFKASTGKNLNLSHPKTFNEKIQWLKLFDTTPLKTRLTDKVLVRDWVKEKIGKEYLKPVLWIGEKFDDIPFETLPQAFIIKANNGCKWHFIIKDKEKFLSCEEIFSLIKMRFDGWMKQSFFPVAGFEMQYKEIEPKILIEPLMQKDIDIKPTEIEIYCFNGIPKIFQKIKYTNPREVNIYNTDFNNINLKFMPDYVLIKEEADKNLKEAVTLSRELSKGFKLVRVDWLIFQEKIYFNEMTFTPFSGFYKFEDENWNYKLGKMLNLKERISNGI